MYQGCGIGLKHQHVPELLSASTPIDWVEVHSENYMGVGGVTLELLQEVRKKYPVSLHGIGLSLGSDEPLSSKHLEELKDLVQIIDPIYVSEHLSWSRLENVFLNDLLPLPLTEETLEVVCSNVTHMQDFLQRKVLIENPSTYLSFKADEIPEPEFLAELAKRTGCGVLLDVNNVYVSAQNNDFDAYAYIDQIPTGIVEELHLAGHASRQVGEEEILLDHHGCRVADPVWDLFQYTIQRFGQISTLIEWDTNVPELSVLIEEQQKAKAVLEYKERRYG